MNINIIICFRSRLPHNGYSCLLIWYQEPITYSGIFYSIQASSWIESSNWWRWQKNYGTSWRKPQTQWRYNQSVWQNTWIRGPGMLNRFIHVLSLKRKGFIILQCNYLTFLWSFWKTNVCFAFLYIYPLSLLCHDCLVMWTLTKPLNQDIQS